MTYERILWEVGRCKYVHAGSLSGMHESGNGCSTPLRHSLYFLSKAALKLSLVHPLQINLHMGFSRDEPWLYLSGDNPELLDVYPELGYLRDIVYLLKAFMAPTSDALPEVKMPNTSPWIRFMN